MYIESKQALAEELELKRPAVLAVSGAHNSGNDSFRLREAGAEGVAVYSGTRYLLTEEFRLTEQDLLALFERHGYDLVLLEGFKSSGWPKVEVVRREIADAPVSFQPLAVVGDIPGADFGLEDIQPLADWIIAQMPTL